MTTKTIEGTPMEIGQGIFIDICIPIIQQASQRMNEQELVMLYAGFIGAQFGALAADLGPDKAIEVIETISEAFASQVHQLTTKHTMQ